MRAGSWKSTDAPRMGAIKPLSSLIRGASSSPIIVFGGQHLVSMNIALIDGITYICASLRHECPKTWTDVTEIIGALGSHVLFGKPPTNHPQGWWPSHDSNSSLYMTLANQPRFKFNSLKIAWNKKKHVPQAVKWLSLGTQNSFKTHRSRNQPPTRCQLSWCQMMFYYPLVMSK